MSAVTAKMIGGNDGTHSEPEKDANSLLMELDKGLRSAKIGEQCESIVRFPRLFEKYPFPILINSAFLKLADVFRVGSNFLRQCILKVTQQSEKHLDKIWNVNEFVHRVYSVIHSNDPVARAITLRTLGQLARITAERKNIHHSVINGLDSHDAVEQEAAIFAAFCFAAQSRSFAASISVKLTEMIEGLETPVHIKLKLIPIFQHMHYESASAEKVRELCTQLLPSYPSQAFTLVILDTLSRLAAKSRVDIPQQVELLLQFVRSDCRRPVQLLALRDLQLLAERGPHMWTQEQILALCRTGLDTPYGAILEGTLHVVTTLSKGVAVSKFPTDSEGPCMELCNKACYDTRVKIGCRGVQLLTDLAAHNANDTEDLSETACSVLQMLLAVTVSEESQHAHSALKMCLGCIVKLCKCLPLLADRFIDTIITSLGSQTGSGSNLLCLCECLSALSSHQSDLMSSVTPELIEVLQAVSKSTLTHRYKITVSVVTLLLQASLEEGLSDQVVHLISDVLITTDDWTVYKVARQAARYGHHSLAAGLFKSLMNKVYSEHYHFWLSALKECCLGEGGLSTTEAVPVNEFMRRVSQAETHYHNGITALKAATTPSCTMDFQIEYLKRRTLTLQVLAQVVRSCCSFQTSPPPAIAAARTLTTGQEIHRCGHVVAQFQKSSRKLDELCQWYDRLYQASFDADPVSLANLQLLHHNCRLMIHVIDTLLIHSQSIGSSNGRPTFSMPQMGSSLESQRWNRMSNQVLDMLHNVCQEPSQPPLAHQHVECMQHAAMMLAGVPLCFPRFFFQRLQATEIKLAITPQPRTPSDPITVPYDTRLTLKVEGVIQHGARPGLYRNVCALRISTHSAQQSKASLVTDEKMNADTPKNQLTQTVAPHNDYFTGQFLLSLPQPGLHQVGVDVAMLDAEGAVWEAGSSTTLMVKSYDEAAQRQQQQNYAAQRQQMRAALIAGGSSSSH